MTVGMLDCKGCRYAMYSDGDASGRGRASHRGEGQCRDRVDRPDQDGPDGD